MRAILLCAGRGSRLLPLTMERPKCLVPVAGRAILDHQIDSLRSKDVDTITIVGGYRIRDIAEHLRARGADPSIELVANPFWSVTSSISSVWIVRRFLNAPFCLMNGDNVLTPTVVADAHDGSRRGLNLAVEAITPGLDDMRVSVAEDRITSIGKALDADVATYRSLGIVIALEGSPAYRATLEDTVMEDGGPNLFHHEVLHRLAPHEVVNPVVVDSDWIEIDAPSDIAAWERRFDLLR